MYNCSVYYYYDLSVIHCFTRTSMVALQQMSYHTLSFLSAATTSAQTQKLGF